MQHNIGASTNPLFWPKESAISRCRWNGEGFSFTTDAVRTIEMNIQMAKRAESEEIGEC